MQTRSKQNLPKGDLVLLAEKGFQASDTLEDIPQNGEATSEGNAREWQTRPQCIR